MQGLLIIVVALGCAYYLGTRRRLDAFTVAFFSAVIYFLPGLVGYTLSPVSPRTPVKVPVELETEAVAIMLAATTALLLGGMAWSALERRLAGPLWRLEDARLAPLLALLLGMLGVALTVVESGPAAFAADKRVVVEAVGRGHLLWQVGGALAVVLGFAQRQRVVHVLGWLLLAGDMVIGFRYAFAGALVAVALLWLGAGQPRRLGSIRLRHWVAVLLGGLFIISFQNLKEPLRAGDWAEIGARLSNPLWYGAGILTSEPFTTQTVMNEIVRHDFRTGADHLLGASSHLVLFSSDLGGEPVRFNELYQPALFPLVDHGLANNIWAQMWSAGDWPLLVAWCLVFVTGLAALSWLLRVPDPLVRGWAALATAYFAFYAHRNELLGIVGMQKQVLLVWAGCVVAAILVRHAVPVRTAQAGEVRP